MNTLIQPTIRKIAIPSVVQKIARISAIGLLRILAALVIVLLVLPVALLPVATSVPAPIWVLLAVLDAALVAALFWFKSTVSVTLTVVAGLFIVALLAVAASQAFASTPPITGSDGKPLANSIATLEKVDLNGSQQWISIRGKDANNPILLFLAGGPGGSQLATARHALGGLEEHFVVVNWEQPGAGKSFHSVDRSKLTPERYLADAHELVLYLRQRFGQEKIYVLGESWGSALGIWMVQREPELYHAFIGTGQDEEDNLVCNRCDPDISY